jgi:hypothetical protein
MKDSLPLNVHALLKKEMKSDGGEALRIPI